MKIAVIDYGAGNLKSVCKSLSFIGFDSVVTDDAGKLDSCFAMILPGVGAFPDAMASIREKGLDEVVCRQAEKKPLLGICLGMQLLFETGYEFGECAGLGLIGGTVEKLQFGAGLKIPHMGWNSLAFHSPSVLYRGCEEGYVYFVHSYGAKTPASNITAYTDYGQKITASVENGNIFGTQFHPEKSGNYGLKILKNFCDYANRG